MSKTELTRADLVFIEVAVRLRQEAIEESDPDSGIAQRWRNLLAKIERILEDE